MQVDEATGKAKSFTEQAFAGEKVLQIRLEEVEFDEVRDTWLVTLGILQPAVDPRMAHGSPPEGPVRRSYKGRGDRR